MAHHVEPMDIDSDFDNKENSLHHNNVLPFTEKGYEELDVSELNMKLRYSITPASSPMSKSYTANCIDNRSIESGDDSLNVTVSENSNLTRSLNSTMTKSDNLVKSLKSLPLQVLPTEKFVDNSRTSVLRPLDSTIIQDSSITVTVSRPNDIDENLSLPSTSSSAVQTPEATTPTKDIQKTDSGSPIMRGLKSVLNMFRSSQSPIPPADGEDVKPDILSPAEGSGKSDDTKTALLISTPIASHRKKEVSPTKKSSPHKDSIVFKDDLEKELQWKDETTILFSQERVPIHKLLFQQITVENKNVDKDEEIQQPDENLDSTVEYMDISYNDSIRDRTMTDAQTATNSTFTGESDGEFLDCETTFTKHESLIQDNDKTPVNDNTIDLDVTKDIDNATKNTSGSRLKQIILNTTQDILDATLSITPEDLIPALDRTKDISGKTILEHIDKSTNCPTAEKVTETTDVVESSEKSEESVPVSNKTLDIINPVNLEVKEDPSVSQAIVSDVQPKLDHTVNIIESLSNTQELNITPVKENILSNTVAKNLSIIAGNLDSTSEPNVIDTRTIEDIVSRLSTDCPSDLILTTLLDTDQNKIEFGKPHSFEYNSIPAENTQAAISSPVPLEEAITKPLLVDNKLENSSVKETTITELPVDIPLPDEDDLEKELNDPITAATEVATATNSLPLDLVGEIAKSETPELIQNMPPEEIKLEPSMNKGDQIDLPELLPLSAPKDADSVENQAEALGPKAYLVVADIAEENHVNIQQKVDAQNENIDVEKCVNNQDKIDLPELLPLSTPKDANSVENQAEALSSKAYVVFADASEENQENIQQKVDTQAENIDVLPDSLSTLNIIGVYENEIELEKLLNEIETRNKTENDQNLTQNQSVLPMDINASVMEPKPLPDIINQMRILPNIASLTSEHIISDLRPAMKESATLTENSTADQSAGPEITPTTQNQPVHAEETEMVDPLNVNTKVTEDPLLSVINNIEHCTKQCINAAPEKITDVELDKIDVNLPESKIPEIQPPGLDSPVEEGTEIKTLDEEIILSENNSPFVSVIAENLSEKCPKPDEGIELNIVSEFKTDRVSYSPPSSPPIASKGYNFNFDEIDDPFATKTKIRLSPPLDSPNKTLERCGTSKSFENPMPKKEIINRRKSQHDRKKPVAPKRKFNSSCGDTGSEKIFDKSSEKLAAGDIKLDSPVNVALDPSIVTIEEDKIIHEASLLHEETLNLTKALKAELEMNKKEEENEIPVNISEKVITDEFKEIKTTSSSEQSTVYYSASTSSSESLPSKNVFNLPEIDDINFNPFATKSKMRQSPPLSLDIENPFATKCKIQNSVESIEFKAQNTAKNISSDDKMEIELMEKDAAENLSNITISSKATDEKNVTTREVNTEDEDTVEGPFLETEDLNTDDKLSDFDGDNIDMMQFHDKPVQGNEDNNQDNGELFIDAEAFEFLLNQNMCNTVVDSGKESLFLKFDPLFAKRMSAVTSDGVVASLSKLQKRQSTPTKTARSPQKEVISPIPKTPNLNVTQDMDINVSEEFNDDLNITVSKPTMAVPPAVNPVTPRNKSLTPNRSNRRSITFTSPAMAVIDRLLSLSGNSSLVHDTTATQVTREHNETDIALTQLRELLAEKEIHVYSLKNENKELKDRLASLESHLKSLEEESQERLKKINELNEKLAEKTKTNKSMAAVVEEYERTIASLISETAQDKKRHAEERIKLINERDEQTAHLSSMEVSFSDLHSKYEKSKQVILNCKANEEIYKKSIKEFEDSLNKMQTNYELLKQHATSKLNHANLELEKMNRSHEAEVLKLNAMIKRKELHITSLEESLTQKTKANEELTAICDELINKVG